MEAADSAEVRPTHPRLVDCLPTAPSSHLRIHLSSTHLSACPSVYHPSTLLVVRCLLHHYLFMHSANTLCIRGRSYTVMVGAQGTRFYVIIKTWIHAVIWIYVHLYKLYINWWVQTIYSTYSYINRIYSLMRYTLTSHTNHTQIIYYISMYIWATCVL